MAGAFTPEAAAALVGHGGPFISRVQLHALLGSAGVRGADLIGKLMATSDTLEQAIAGLMHYQDRLVPGLNFVFERGEHRCLLTTLAGDDPPTARAGNELIVATMTATARAVLAGTFTADRAWFRHPEPQAGDQDAYHRYFRCPLRFDAPRNALEFSPALLGQPLPGAWPAYRRRLQRAADRPPRASGGAVSLVDRVSDRLRDNLGRRPLTVEGIAVELCMTPRTLQRRLREEGWQFARLRDQVRMDYACRRLSEPHCEMQALATHLGFSDTANFYHAFKRWKGCAPGAYRRDHGL